MARLVPQTFPIPTETAIASYSYTDIADGTGIVEFYPTESSTATSTFVQRMVTSASHYSENNGTTTATGSLNLDFDVTFNKSQTIGGKMYAQIPLSLKASSGTVTISVSLTIIHYDGSTETTIGTAQTSRVLSTTTTSEFVNTMVNLTWNITDKIFKKGDTLRVTLTDTVSGNGTKTIGHSPIGTQRTTAGTEFEGQVNSRATLFVPFKLDI